MQELPPTIGQQRSSGRRWQCQGTSELTLGLCKLRKPGSSKRVSLFRFLPSTTLGLNLTDGNKRADKQLLQINLIVDDKVLKDYFSLLHWHLRPEQNRPDNPSDYVEWQRKSRHLERRAQLVLGSLCKNIFSARKRDACPQERQLRVQNTNTHSKISQMT